MARGSCLALLALALTGCSFIVDDDVGRGIGAACETDDQCQVGQCAAGLCTTSCAAPTDCPQPSICTSAGLCELPLDVGFVYVGVPEDEGWTLTHEEGRQDAHAALPWLRSDFVTNTFLPTDALAAVDTFVAGGAEVVVLNSFSLRDPAQTAAEKYPHVRFLTCSGHVRAPNLGTYFGRMEQAYHLAGFAAAQVTKTKRLGFLGSFITPEVVRHINAFTRGAHRRDPSIVVEVRWEGFWFDLDPPNAEGKYNETVLAELLLDASADVIAHNMDNGRSLAATEARKQACAANPDSHDSCMNTGTSLFSVGNDNRDACKRGPTTCIGTSYWNWGPLYIRMFDEIHRSTWDPFVELNDNIKSNPDQSVPNFSVNTNVASNDLAISVGELLADLAKAGNEKKAFEVFTNEGEYCSTGQRQQCVQAGEKLSDEELRTMCWFVEGVVQKSDPDDPTSADVPAQVPQPECDTQQ
jgi:basic membrane protein A and related proteins